MWQTKEKAGNLSRFLLRTPFAFVVVGAAAAGVCPHFTPLLDFDRKAMAELAQSREDYLDDDGDDNNVHEVGETRDTEGEKNRQSQYYSSHGEVAHDRRKEFAREAPEDVLQRFDTERERDKYGQRDEEGEKETRGRG